MNAREGVDISKMAVSVLLICLVLGAGITFFYFGYDKTTAKISGMQESAASSTMSRLMEFDDMSGNFASSGGGTQSALVTANDLPLVANVAAVIQHADIELAYIAVVHRESTRYVCKVFTPTGVELNIESAKNSNLLASNDESSGEYNLDIDLSATPKIDYYEVTNDTPNITAAKHMMQFSNQVCIVDVVENVGDLGINGVVITLKGEKYNGN